MFDIYYIALKNLYRRRKNRLESVNQPIYWRIYTLFQQLMSSVCLESELANASDSKMNHYL